MFDLLLSNSFNFIYIFKTVKTRWYYYVGALAFVIILCCFLFFKKQNKRNNLTKTQKLVYISILTALSVVCNAFLTFKITEFFQISFVATIGFISGYMLGGGAGFAVGFIGDLIGAIIFPQGPYNPIIGIGTGCYGLIPGLAFTMFRGNDYVKAIVSFIICFVIISAGINTLGLCLMYPKMYAFETSVATLPFKLIVTVINCSLSIGLMVVLKRCLPKSKFNF